MVCKNCNCESCPDNCDCTACSSVECQCNREVSQPQDDFGYRSIKDLDMMKKEV